MLLLLFFATVSGFTVHRIITEGVGSVLPSAFQRAILDGIFTTGRVQLSESLLNEKNPLGSSRLTKQRRLFEEGKSLQLQFPAEDLGFRHLPLITILRVNL
jgi:hypothetical protein